MEVRYGGRRRQTGSRSSFYSSSTPRQVQVPSRLGLGLATYFSSSHLSSTFMDMETAMHLLDLKLDEDMRSGMHLLELKLDEEMRSWSVIEKERKDTEYVAVEPINNKSLSETEEKEERMKRIKRLVQEFAGDAPSAECSIKGKGKGKGKGPMGVLERWFTELGIGWVLQLDGGALHR